MNKRLRKMIQEKYGLDEIKKLVTLTVSGPLPTDGSNVSLKKRGPHISLRHNYSGEEVEVLDGITPDLLNLIESSDYPIMAKLVAVNGNQVQLKILGKHFSF